MVRSFRASHIRWTAFLDFVKRKYRELNPTKPVADVATRWGSVYEMIKSVLKFREVSHPVPGSPLLPHIMTFAFAHLCSISQAYEDYRKFEPELIPSPGDFKVLTTLQPILKALNVFHRVEADMTITGPMVMIEFNRLVDRLDQLATDVPSDQAPLVNVLVEVRHSTCPFH